MAARAAGEGMECVTLHAGWGIEDDAEAFTLIDAILQESTRLALYVETHRATLFQDMWRTVQFVSRFPELRFIIPHLGGAASSLKGRMMAFFETDDAPIPADMRGYLKTQNEQKQFGITERFEKLFQRLYFDTAGTGAWGPSMAAALNITSADRIMFGSDYPLECKTAANIIESIEMVRQSPCSNADKSAILGSTAAGVFNL